jgi:hypothetical protein
MIPFSLLWGGFAVFWETSAFVDHTPLFFRLWGVPFVLVGLYFIIGRFFVDAWVRGRTSYAVTDRRVLMLRNVFSEQLIAANLDCEMRLRKERDGRGTIEFGPQISAFARNRSWSSMTPALADSVTFIGIDDVMGVYRLVQPDAQV